MRRPADGARPDATAGSSRPGPERPDPEHLNTAHPDLELSDDPGFERRTLTFERVGWTVMAVVVGAALLGAFGSGPLSHAHARTPDGTLSVDYERFGRSGAPLMLVIRAAAGADGRARVAFDRTYLDGVRSTEVRPTPAEVQPSQTRSTYVFVLDGPGRPFTLRLALTPDRAGPLRGNITAPSGAVVVRQFIYP